ncbi:MAG: glycoside hydrolase family 3 N-terminal domain-containing protein [Paracoccaceae bacterium]
MTWGAAILDADGLRLSAAESRFFREADPFGFILFARNMDTPDQVRALCADMREAVGRDAPILIDQEGGRVQRIWQPHVRNWSPPLDFVEAAGDEAERAMYLRYRLIAAELRGLGVDVNCAPTCDLALPQTHAFLRNRCYGDDPAQVATLARAVANGLLDGGVLPIMKHMPGHGRAHLDTHFELPRVAADLDELDQTDFAVFRALNDLPMGMTGHVVFSALEERAATVSVEAIRTIRDRIGFGGLLMTDDISMEALKGTPAVRTRAAIEAGVDVALFCNAPLAERQAVAEAAEQLSDAAQARAEAALALRVTPEPLDEEAVEDELAALTGSRAYD